MVSTTPDLLADAGIVVEKATRTSVVPVDVARHVLHGFGDPHLGEEGGHFVDSLLRTIARADATNRDKLAQVYPEYVLAFRAVANEPWGLEWLQNIVRSAS